MALLVAPVVLVLVGGHTGGSGYNTSYGCAGINNYDKCKFTPNTRALSLARTILGKCMVIPVI